MLALAGCFFTFVGSGSSKTAREAVLQQRIRELQHTMDERIDGTSPHENAADTERRIRDAMRDLPKVRKELADIEQQIDGDIALAAIMFWATLGCLIGAAVFKTKTVPRPGW